MKLLDVYRAILEYARHTGGQHGNIFATGDEKKTQIALNGKDMVLPAPEMLNSVENRLYFHPFREQTHRDIPETTQEYVERLVLALNNALGMTFIALAEIVGSPKIHSQIDPSRKDLLKAVPDCDEDMAVKVASNVLREIKKGRQSGLIRMYVKKGGTKKENGAQRKYARLGVVFFPFYESIKEGESTLTKKEQAAFSALYKFVFDQIDDSEAYNQGSQNNLAPTIDAVLRASLGITSRLDELHDLYKEFSPSFDNYQKFGSAWLDALDNIQGYDREISRISLLPGSDGHNEEKKEDDVRDAPKPRDEKPRVTVDEVPRRDRDREDVRERREEERDDGKTKDGKIKLSFLAATAPKVRNAPNVMDSTVVSEIEEQWRAELAEAEQYLDRTGRKHPELGYPEDVDRRYRNKMADRDDRQRGRREFRPETRAEELAYGEWLRDRDEVEEYYDMYRKPHPDLGHPRDYDEFDPRDPRYDPRRIEERERDRRDRRDRDYRRDDRDRSYRDRDYRDRDDRRDYRDRDHRDYRDDRGYRGYRDDRDDRGYRRDERPRDKYAAYGFPERDRGYGRR